MTLRELAKALESAGIDTARHDVLLLAGAVSGLGNASLAARYDYELDALPWASHLYELVSRRSTREPLQYILGKWEFYGDGYTVTPDVLIPRPETELLVDFSLSRLKTRAPGALIADVCCGSGCIGISICRRADVRCHSVDISAPALAVAKRNAASLGVADRITFFEADAMKPGFLPAGSYDMIISNPPYVLSSEMEALAPELSFEPVIALDGGVDGMMFYRSIIKNCNKLLSGDGVFVFEIGASLGKKISAVAEEHGFFAEITPDASGLPRMAVLRRWD